MATVIPPKAMNTSERINSTSRNLCDQRAGGGGEIIVNGGGGKAFRQRGLRPAALAAANENGAGADRCGGLQVAQGVADDRHAGERCVEVSCQLLEHPGLRFAALAAIVRAMGTDNDAADVAAGLGYQAQHLGVHRIERALVEEPAGDAGLVAGDRERETGFRQRRNPLQFLMNSSES